MTLGKEDLAKRRARFFTLMSRVLLNRPADTRFLEWHTDCTKPQYWIDCLSPINGLFIQVHFPAFWRVFIDVVRCTLVVRRAFLRAFLISDPTSTSAEHLYLSGEASLEDSF